MSALIPAEGGCHCGAIVYRCEVDPEQVILCHCTDCQTLSGSAFRSVAFVDERSFRLIKGEPKVYIKIADSGNEREQTFCGTCGSPIYSAPHEPPGARMLGIRAGTLKQRDQLIPKKQYFKESGLCWADDLSGIESVGAYSGKD